MPRTNVHGRGPAPSRGHAWMQGVRLPEGRLARREAAIPTRRQESDRIHVGIPLPATALLIFNTHT